MNIDLRIIPNDQERMTLLRSLIPASVADDQEIADTAAKYRGWNLEAIMRRLRSIYISILTFEGEEDRKHFIPPQMTQEDQRLALFQLNVRNFGVCPECGYLGSYFFVNGIHWLVCELHQVKWNVSHFHIGDGFKSWQRHLAIMQCLTPIELPDISQYEEIVQPIPEPWLDEFRQLAIELRVIHHNQKLLDWLKTQDHDFAKAEEIKK